MSSKKREGYRGLNRSCAYNFYETVYDGIMYHSRGYIETKEDYPNRMGINMQSCQDLYLDSSTQSSPNLSPISSNAPLSPFAKTFSIAEEFEAKVGGGGSESAAAPESQYYANFGGAYTLGSTVTCTSASAPSKLNNYSQCMLQQQQLLLQQQQQQQQQLEFYHQQQLQQQQFLLEQQNTMYQQQQMATAAASQHQFIHTATGQSQQQDEISKSLKIFAMLTAFQTENERGTYDQPPVETIMQDFASNGQTCDERQQYPQYYQFQTPMAFHHVNNNGGGGCVGVGVGIDAGGGGGHNLNLKCGISVSNQLNQQMFNPNLNEARNNFWKMLPKANTNNNITNINAATATATAANTNAAKFDYNSNKKPQKRYNGGKSEKFAGSRHCVFCENNNEPDAVVKSHAVRDSFGRVLCPKLRTYICPICKASGDKAHTVKYCPQKPIITMEDALKAESFRLAKGGTIYNHKMKI